LLGAASQGGLHGSAAMATGVLGVPGVPAMTRATTIKGRHLKTARKVSICSLRGLLTSALKRINALESASDAKPQAVCCLQCQKGWAELHRLRFLAHGMSKELKEGKRLMRRLCAVQVDMEEALWVYKHDIIPNNDVDSKARDPTVSGGSLCVCEEHGLLRLMPCSLADQTKPFSARSCGLRQLLIVPQVPKVSQVPLASKVCYSRPSQCHSFSLGCLAAHLGASAI
jgi:hypothetical protein